MVVLLALVGMICWGIAPIFAKIGLSNMSPIAGLSIRTLFTAGIIMGWMIVDGTITNVKNVSVSTLAVLAIEAILATFIGDLAYFAAIKKGDVSLVTIIMSSSPLITLLFAAMFLGEHITTIRYIGSALIILGIILII